MHVKKIFSGVVLPIKHVQIRLEEHEYDALKKQADAADEGLQEFGRKFLLGAVESGKGSGPGPRVPPTLQPYLRRLAEVLASGDEMAIEAVTKNIDFFRDRLKPSGRKPR